MKLRYISSYFKKGSEWQKNFSCTHSFQAMKIWYSFKHFIDPMGSHFSKQAIQMILSYFKALTLQKISK